MANLIEHKFQACEFAALEAARLMQLRHRLISVQATVSSWDEGAAESKRFDRGVMAETFADDLEEFEIAVSEPTLDALLGEIDARRRTSAAASQSHHGSTLPIASGCVFGVHSFGRSLATGEAEIASRGFFDERDRPPLELWIETVRQPSLRRDEGAGLGVLFFVPEEIVVRARAGFAVCRSGALTLIDEQQPELSAQLHSIAYVGTCESRGVV